MKAIHGRAVLRALPVLAWLAVAPVQAGQYVETPYAQEQRVVFELYLEDPAEIGAALYWLRAYINPLMVEPYSYPPEFMDIKVVVHGTEIVTLAERNYARYESAVERMRYYAQLGVEFKVCALAAEDYGYADADFYDFVDIVPSAITEMAHWQQMGYALIRPEVATKRFAIEDIR
jgi:intracellular sulfur oxidation DsrE/DsrF family protein